MTSLCFCICRKIGKLTLARLLTALDATVNISSSTSPQMVHVQEILALYCDLVKMDPTHSQYYKEEHSLALLRQVSIYLNMFIRRT